MQNHKNNTKALFGNIKNFELIAYKAHLQNKTRLVNFSFLRAYSLL